MWSQIDHSKADAITLQLKSIEKVYFKHEMASRTLDATDHEFYTSDIDVLNGKISWGRRSRSQSPEKQSRPRSPYDRKRPPRIDARHEDGEAAQQILVPPRPKSATMVRKRTRDPAQRRRPKSAHASRRAAETQQNIKAYEKRWAEKVKRAPRFRQKYLQDLERQTFYLLRSVIANERPSTTSPGVRKVKRRRRKRKAKRKSGVPRGSAVSVVRSSRDQTVSVLKVLGFVAHLERS